MIFGHYRPHPEMATALELPAPTLGRFVSARLYPWADTDPEPFVELPTGRWRRARGDDPVVAAPQLPKQTEGA